MDENTKQILSTALRAICLTRDCVGSKALPAVKGYEWFDAGKAIAEVIPEDEWAIQFTLRVKNCPHCSSTTGIKYPRDDTFYCEDCGWPNEDFSDDKN